MLVESQSGHTAGPLGMADVFAALYFHELRYDPKKPEHKERDYVFLSNGHICPVWYATLSRAGFFPRKDLFTLRKINGKLQGHPHLTTPGVENSGGPLGQGTSQSCGAALGLKQDNARNRVYCLTSDGELEEGQPWEAAMFATKYNLDNLCWIVDRNHIQIDNFTDAVMPLGNLGAKFRSFGWHVIRCSGHDIEGLVDAFKRARTIKGKPSIIIAHTIPGRGVKAFENDYHWHGKVPSKEEGQLALKELRGVDK